MSIKINYKNVKDKVDNINEAKSKLETQRNRIQRISDNLNGTWQGIVADEFKSKLDNLIIELDNAIKDMGRLAEDITNVAQNIKNTDEQLASDVSTIGSISGFSGNGGGFR